MTPDLGIAGRLARTFLNSKLTPLFIAASLAIGIFAVAIIPREEEPQILVPMLDIATAMPGASPAEVEERVTLPIEKLVHEISGVEYVYSTSAPGQSLVIVRFLVGTPQEDALINRDLMAASSQRLRHRLMQRARKTGCARVTVDKQHAHRDLRGIIVENP